MKRLICAAVAGLVLSEVQALNSDMYAVEAMEPVRPGGVNGSPFWNKYARGFIYPPAFDFSSTHVTSTIFSMTNQTVKYLFTVLDSDGKIVTFEAGSPKASLAPVWNQLPPGQTWVYMSTVDKDGEINYTPDWPREKFRRMFWKKEAFRPGAYEKAPRSYGEAIRLSGKQLFNFPTVQSFLKSGKPDFAYQYNCYPSKIYGAIVRTMLEYAKVCPEKAEEAMKAARSAADYLMETSFAAGTALEYFPLTYGDTRWAGASRMGQVMLCYPCEVGEEYLDLYEVKAGEKYLAAARRIGETYLKLQEADGTWSVLMRGEDGKKMSTGRLQPVRVMMFLERLSKVTGEGKYRDAADRAFKWVEKNVIAEWCFEGQFEDVGMCEKYENMSEHMAVDAAFYALERFPGDKKWLQFARDVARFSEDQFVFWEKPVKNGQGINTPYGVPGDQQCRYDDWFYPCVVEQYSYYVPIDSANAKMIQMYLALYRVEKNPLDLEKARALADAIVRIQDPDNGYIPTEYAKVAHRHNPQGGWFNCTYLSFKALLELDEVLKKESAAK